jgi:undecaprenyl-diphosphatase
MKPLALLLVLGLSPIQTFDGAVREWALDAHTPALDVTMRTASHIGTPTVVLGALLAIAVLDPVEGVAVARTALVALVPTNIAVESLKRLTQRTRPDGEHNPANSSFPSSHAANAMALAYVFARRWKKGAPVFWLAATLVAVSRVYLGRHYMSDVVVGMAIGICCGGWAVWLMSRRGRRTGRREGAAAPEAAEPASR